MQFLANEGIKEEKRWGNGEQERELATTPFYSELRPCIEVVVLEVVFVLALLPTESDMNFLIKIALEKVAFLPYGYLMDKYRWEIGNITFPEENCNKEYWKLRYAYSNSLSNRYNIHVHSFISS